jgi:hypothetical protein
MGQELRRLSSLAKSPFTAFAAVCAAFLAVNAEVRAATPVDIYQDMAGGNDGDLLTPAGMNASTHPGAAAWAINGGPWFVSTRHARSAPAAVTVDGVAYSGTGGSRTWMLNTNNAMNYVWVHAGKSDSRPAITLAFYYTTDLSVRNYHIYDTVSIYCQDGTYGCMQTRNGDGQGPKICAHSCDAKGKTTYSPAMTRITAGKTYWINLNYNAAGPGTVSLATLDPDNAFAQVGATLVSESRPAKGPWRIWLGRTDNHGNQTNDHSQTWFGQIMIDYTKAAFPLIPSASVPTKSGP